MYVCMYVCNHKGKVSLYILSNVNNGYLSIYLLLYTYSDVPMHVCMYVRTYVCMYVRMHVCMYVRTYAYMYVRTYAYIHVCMYVCMYVCVHTPSFCNYIIHYT